MSVTYTTAHSNAGSLTHWARPGIEPKTSWFLVGFISAVPQRERLQFSSKQSLQLSPHRLWLGWWLPLPLSWLDTFCLKSICLRSSPVAYWLRIQCCQLPWLKFDPWPGDFWMPWMQPKKKKKKESLCLRHIVLNLPSPPCCSLCLGCLFLIFLPSEVLLIPLQSTQMPHPLTKFLLILLKEMAPEGEWALFSARSSEEAP